MRLLSKRTQTQIKATYEVTGSDIVKALRKAGMIPENGGASITLRVPGGGDYSNMDLDLMDHPVTIKIDDSWTS